ncbi:hypothetical protein [Corynebacterium minutissimum]|uniref:Putative secreted protein n=1 Tax=Corynebacterium minutissimum TaxID=38301 RepID=A0A2X4R8E5_9CORY|nr:hypothetical protein [Corynebacterium minutissimum]KHO30677.1 hypothetical protein NX84_00370 [Corynebacterium minutissimum]MCG7230152.1 hypothetical protein [Corynebacterium minutissimum]MCG7239231.1 hypothetical protein [Corynebacterium minutissimum]SQH98369.1 putative secreted protein [Corynebacterium minutissimum]VEG04540.1 putative secreted protein [Corynebacterium minutissimum]
MRTRRLNSSARVTAAALLAAGALLAGCGSATVDESEATETSVAPLERSAGSSEGAESSSTSNSSAASSSDKASSGSGSSRGSGEETEDRGAREISEIPAPAPAEGPHQEFLAALSDGGVNTEGVEDQLVGAAQAACQGDTVTVPAVAGQLIEQGRSELSHEQLTQLISEKGGALCAE